MFVALSGCRVVALGSAGAWAVLVGIERKLAEELAGGGVDDADLEVVDEQEDVGSGVGSTDIDVVQAAVDAQGHAAGFVEPVGGDPFVGVAAAVG
jgi:hypothetical protein